MADEHKAPVSGAAAAAAPAPAKGGMNGLIGIAAGGLVLVLVGAGSALYITKMFKPKTTGEGTTAAAEGEHAKEHEVDAKTTKELYLGELITNITGDPRRYVKIACTIWVSTEDAHHLEPASEGEIQVAKVVKMALEEQLKRYELADLTSRGIISSISQDFQVVIENTLHAQFPDKPKDYRFVKKVILNNLLVQ